MIDLSQLAAPEIVETLDFETLLAERKAELVALYPDEDQSAVSAAIELESEPTNKMLQASCYREIVLRQRINDAAKAVMLAYSTGANLDHLAALFGVSRLDGEADSRMRSRTQLSLEGLSTAGPSGSYEFHSMSASSQVRDVYIDSPEPGTVRVVVLAEPDAENVNGVPAQALLDTVQAVLTAEDVRPLCDAVQVAPAEVIAYAVSASLICQPGPDVNVVIAAALAACQSYVETQLQLGCDVTISGLHAALHQAGVTQVDLVSPTANISVGPDQAARCTGVTVTLGGVRL